MTRLAKIQPSSPETGTRADSPSTHAAADMRLYSVLLNLESAARQQNSVDDLRFQIVNETHRLLGYFQCFTWAPGSAGGVRITAVSGVSEVDANAPVVVVMQSIVKGLLKREDHNKVIALSSATLGGKIEESWDSWFPEHALWCPFVDDSGRVFGGFFLTRERGFRKSEIQASAVAADAYGHAWRALKPRPRSRSLVRTVLSRSIRWLLFASITAAMFIPVRQSVLAPSEIIALDPMVVTSPLDGVIASFDVKPNQLVTAGEPLFRFDNTKANNELLLAESALRVAEADYRRATNKSFNDRRSKAERQTFRLRVEEKQLERDFNEAQLQKTVVAAGRSGIAVFNEANEWIGRPVKIGERILTLADPAQNEIEIWLDVADSTNLDIGSDVELFLNIDPARPLKAIVRQTSYKPSESPNGTIGFRLKASLVESSQRARLGLKGTAKIYGDRVSLFYFLFRRPWSVFRQKFGV